MQKIIIKSTDENANKILVLATRLNTVITKLNSLANKAIEFEEQKSQYILNNQKSRSVAQLIETICVDLDRLMEEESSLQSWMATAPPLKFIAKHQARLRLEQIDDDIRKKQNQLAELRPAQIKTRTAVNLAKSATERTCGADTYYFEVAEKEFNPLTENLSRLSGTNLQKHDLKTICTLEPIYVEIEKEFEEEMA